jgi:hypothetical protein
MRVARFRASRDATKMPRVNDTAEWDFVQSLQQKDTFTAGCHECNCYSRFFRWYKVTKNHLELSLEIRIGLVQVDLLRFKASASKQWPNEDPG